jgi:AraC-like DNA-binding protein
MQTENDFSVVTVVNRRTVARKTPLNEYKIPANGITLFLQGNARIRQGGDDFPPIRPLLWFLPANTEASEEVDAGPFHTIYAVFRLPGLQVEAEGRNALRVTWNENTLCVPRWKVPDADAVTYVVDLFARLKKAHETPRLAGAIRAGALMLELFSFYLDAPDGSTDLMGHRALARAQNLLQTRGGDGLSFSDLAKKSGVSEGYLRSLFRQRLGSSPVKYRNNLRLMRARDMLLSTDMSVKEAAASVGFQDQLYFSRIFRGHFGISPRELIRKHRLPVFDVRQ